jgi:outer membrane receptor for ferric coprogen and ferric-rhodotorulic acid
MNTTPCSVPIPTRVLLAVVCTTLAVSSLQAQSTGSALAQDAKALAKYDTNKNGRLDPEELAAKQADEARAAAAPVATSAAQSDVVELSPFQVTESDKGYYASNTLAGTRINTKLEDLGASISVVTKQQM